jgi:hypothetical protein
LHDGGNKMIDASTANLALFSTAMGFSLVSSFFDM